jgi:hypothetical protein
MMYKALSFHTEAVPESAVSLGHVPEKTDISQVRAILIALLFGDRSGLSPRTVDFFQGGACHSLALSRQHQALASMAGVAMVMVLSCVWFLFLKSCPGTCHDNGVFPCSGLSVYGRGAVVHYPCGSYMVSGGLFVIAAGRFTCWTCFCHCTGSVCQPSAVLIDLFFQLSVLAWRAF